MPRDATYNLRVNTATAQQDMERFFRSVRQQTRPMAGGGATAAGRATQDPAMSLKALTAGVYAFAASAAVRQIGQMTVDLMDLGTEARRAGAAFEYVSGGADKAAANLAAVNRASQGTLDTLTAQRIATQALNLGLAGSADELERVTTIARGVVAVSPTINDMQGAFSELSLTLANMSWRRLDQLGLSVAEVRDEYERLRKANAGLTDEQAFAQAVLGTAETKFRELATGADFAATGLERVRAKWADMRAEIGQEIDATGILNKVADAMDTRAQMGARFEVEDALRLVESDRNRARGGMIEMETLAAQMANSRIKYKEDAILIASFKAQAELYRRELADLNQQWVDGNVALAKMNPQIWEQAQAMGALTDAINPALQSVEAMAGAGESVISPELQATMDAAADMAAAIGDAVESAGRAAESRVYGITGNADEAVQAYEDITAALWDFVRAQQTAGKSDASILNMLGAEAERVAEIRGMYDEAAAGADKLTDAGLRLGRAFGGSAAVGMQIFNRQLATTVSMLPSVANVMRGVAGAAATGAPGRYTAVIPRRGVGLGDVRIPGYTTPSAPMEYARGGGGLSPAERQAWQAWEDAAGDAAEAWADELKSALQGVPGLYGTSDVTAADMKDAELGIYQEKADEYLRQLRDEVYNGKDYAGVDIKDAAARLGIDPNQNPEAILRQFESAWADSSLFAGGRNLDLINEEAVQRELERQRQSESGRNAIGEYFGLPGEQSGQAIGTAFGQAAQQEAPAIGQSIAANMTPGSASSMFGDAGMDFGPVVQSMSSSMKAAMGSDDQQAAFGEVGKTAIRYIFTGARDGELLTDLAEQLLEDMYEAISDAASGGDGGE